MSGILPLEETIPTLRDVGNDHMSRVRRAILGDLACIARTGDKGIEFAQNHILRRVAFVLRLGTFAKEYLLQQ